MSFFYILQKGSDNTCFNITGNTLLVFYHLALIRKQFCSFSITPQMVEGVCFNYDLACNCILKAVDFAVFAPMPKYLVKKDIMN